jgi:hypothetical protein
MKDCFASRFPHIAGECSETISKEHYISEAVLREISWNSNSVEIAGAGWQPTPEPKSVGIGSMVSKILCDRHNNGLTRYDTAAKSFFQFLRPRSRLNTTVDGSDLEKWFLKTLIGLYESKVLKSPVHGFTLQNELYMHLFQESTLSYPMGLTIATRAQTFKMGTELIVGPYFNEKEVFSYVFKIFSIEIHLPFSALSLSYSNYFRPLHILKRTKDGDFKMELNWKNGMTQKPETYLLLIEND